MSFIFELHHYFIYVNFDNSLKTNICISLIYLTKYLQTLTTNQQNHRQPQNKNLKNHVNSSHLTIKATKIICLKHKIIIFITNTLIFILYFTNFSYQISLHI